MNMRFKYFFILFLILFFFLTGMNSLTARYDNLERMSVTIKARVEWDETTKDDDGEPLYNISGFYAINIDGFLKFNEKNSPVVNKGGIMVMPGLNKTPRALRFYIDDNGEIHEKDA